MKNPKVNILRYSYTFLINNCSSLRFTAHEMHLSYWKCFRWIRHTVDKICFGLYSQGKMLRHGYRLCINLCSCLFCTESAFLYLQSCFWLTQSSRKPGKHLTPLWCHVEDINSCRCVILTRFNNGWNLIWAYCFFSPLNREGFCVWYRLCHSMQV